MNQQDFDQLVKHVEEFVKQVFKDHDPSHDFLHVKRVTDLALVIANDEIKKGKTVDLQLVQLAALLHDIGDGKYQEVQKERFKELGYQQEPTIAGYLVENNCPKELANRVSELVNGVSFRKEAFNPHPQPPSIELAIVRDSDKLDAIGSIGIARCLAFGATKNRTIHDLDQETDLVRNQRNGSTKKPWTIMTKEEYAKGGGGTCVAHFYEKLFHLSGMLNTEKAKEIAKKRDAIMHEFINQLEAECAGLA